MMVVVISRGTALTRRRVVEAKSKNVPREHLPSILDILFTSKVLTSPLEVQQELNVPSLSILGWCSKVLHSRSLMKLQ